MRIILFSSPDQKNIFQFHKRKEKSYSFKIFYYFSEVESKLHFWRVFFSVRRL